MGTAAERLARTRALTPGVLLFAFTDEDLDGMTLASRLAEAFRSIPRS